MSIFEKFKQDVLMMLSAFDPIFDINSTLSIPDKREFGNITTNIAFRLKDTLKKSPTVIANDFANTIKPNGLVSKIEAKNGYINFFINNEKYINSILEEASQNDYGSSNVGADKVVVFDYSSPNIAKPFGVAHLRSTIIGDSLSKCYNFLGYYSVRINYLGDWGTQFGKLMEGYKRWGNIDEIKNNPLEESMKLYVKFNEEAEKDPTLDSYAREWFKKLESHDKEAIELWSLFKNASISYFNKIYKLLNVEFDSIDGESMYGRGNASETVLKILEKLSITKIESDNSVIIDLDKYGLGKYGLGKTIIQKNDGSTIYILRDILAAIDRQNRYMFDISVYVVGSDQNLHFKQLFKTLELMGNKWATNCKHVEFGLINISGKKMSTRKGRIVLLEDVLKQSIDRVEKIIEKRDDHTKAIDIKSIANSVGIGAIKFAVLSHERRSAIDFNWDRILDFNGDTGPYIQYAYARACKLLEKNNIKYKKVDIFFPDIFIRPNSTCLQLVAH
ncbi:MAG: arginine--tRNA ligase, partial [Candidatus Marsarchaeota archaeon]|nr:arginine--tRNA ligase [Candidatus Marsarchaeota archaeon]